MAQLIADQVPDALLPKVLFIPVPAGPDDVCGFCPNDEDVPDAEYTVVYRPHWSSGRRYETPVCGGCLTDELRWESINNATDLTVLVPVSGQEVAA